MSILLQRRKNNEQRWLSCIYTLWHKYYITAMNNPPFMSMYYIIWNSKLKHQNQSSVLFLSNNILFSFSVFSPKANIVMFTPTWHLFHHPFDVLNILSYYFAIDLKAWTQEAHRVFLLCTQLWYMSEIIG